MITTHPMPTPPIAILASYYGCPCNYERLLRVGTSEFNGYRYENIIPWNSSEDTWLPVNGNVNYDLLKMLTNSSDNIRNVQLQTRTIHSLTDEESRECFRLAMKHHQRQPNKIERYSDGIKITDGVEYETCLSMELDDEGQILTSADSWLYGSENPALFMSAVLLNYLRSIYIDVDGLGGV